VAVGEALDDGRPSARVAPKSPWFRTGTLGRIQRLITLEISPSQWTVCRTSTVGIYCVQRVRRWYARKMPQPGKDLDWVWVRMSSPWRAMARLVERDGRYLVAELRISTEEVPSSGLTKRDLQSVNLAAADLLIGKESPDFDRVIYLRARWNPPKPSEPRLGKHKSDDEYADIALRYLAACEENPRKPILHMQQEYEKAGHLIERETLRDWVHGARARGFLTPRSPSLPGGQKTPKLRAWERKQRRKS
jgi:hypothetical protein